MNLPGIADGIQYTGVVDQDINMAEGANGKGDEEIHISLVGDVGGDGQGFAAPGFDFVSQGFKLMSISSGQDDACPGLSKGQGRGPADAPAGSGDDGYFVLEEGFQAHKIVCL